VEVPKVFIDLAGEKRRSGRRGRRGYGSRDVEASRPFPSGPARVGAVGGDV